MTVWQCPRCGSVYAGTAPVGVEVRCPSAGCGEVTVEQLPPDRLSALPAAAAPPPPMYVHPAQAMAETLDDGTSIEVEGRASHFVLRLIGPSGEQTITLAGEQIEAAWRLYRKLLVTPAADAPIRAQKVSCDSCQHFGGIDQLSECWAAPTTNFDPVTGQSRQGFEAVMIARQWGACGPEGRLWEPRRD